MGMLREVSIRSKITVVAPEEATVDAAIASVKSELESLSSPKEEQRAAPKALLDGKDVFVFLPNGFAKSLIYQLRLRC